MATTYKTPGVYVEEIPKLPPSVAQVETAIPAFVGYTEKAEKNGESLKLVPTRISSMVEFEQYFGSAYPFEPGDIKIKLDEANNYSVSEVLFQTKVFFLYDAMRLFFDNGGGDCYIVSVNSYSGASFTLGVISSSADLKAGVDELEKYDEPTIILFPDAANLSATEFYPLQQAAIAQCAKLQDRVSVLDLKENTSSDWQTAVDDLRDKIGISNLKYAAAYTPWLVNSYARTVDFGLLNHPNMVVNLSDAPINLVNLTTDSNLNALVTNAEQAASDYGTLETDYNTLCGSFKTFGDKYMSLRNALLKANATASPGAFTAVLAFIRDIVDKFPEWRSTSLDNADMIKTLDALAVDPANGLRKYVTDLIAFEKNADIAATVTSAKDYVATYEDFPEADSNSWLGVNAIADIPASSTDYGETGNNTQKRATALAAMSDLEAIFKGLEKFYANVLDAAKTYKTLAQDALYSSHTIIGNMVSSIKKHLAKIPPSPAVAGIYARVDNARGVWKAPANESINSVLAPSEQITAEAQENLNVDAVAGKSINAIRTFTGKGVLVWGARTLAGNDNEWRYISVRRFFNMVEESSKKATEPFVFEANDANTWVKVQGMLENFLTTLWRQGALQGAKPEHAFYVAVGLGKTMTALDILEGRMIVEIGMAVVRPAEFIILRFSHKMAES